MLSHLRFNQSQTLNDRDDILIDCKGDPIKGKSNRFALFVFFSDPKPQAVYHTYPEEESDWDILGLVEDSSVDDVHIQYKRMVMMYHPDKYAKLSIANQTKTTERFKRIQNAYKNILAKLKRTAMKMGVPQHELQKYSAHFGDISINGSVLNPYIVSV